MIFQIQSTSHLNKMIGMDSNEMLMKFGSILATLMFIKAIYEQYVPHEWRESLEVFVLRSNDRVFRFFSPNLTITFDEFGGHEHWFERCKIYTAVKTYLGENSSRKARGLKASSVDEDGKSLVLGLADNEEVTDEFQGVTVWWNSGVNHNSTSTHGAPDKRYFCLTFHNRHRKLITESYLTHVIESGKEIAIQKRQRKLFTNMNDSGSYGGHGGLWSAVEFKHPASFDTLALDNTKKQAIMTDLVRFRNAKDYYAKIGKPWKRGYLLYGPPGTGKSTMIAAMATFLEYDIYDLELTSVHNNSQLRRLLIETSGKSIIVIEDIDCSLDLTGQRTEIKDKDKDKDKGEDGKDHLQENKKSEVTLSGLLNFIDGIWSACGQERIIVFTTNYIDKLDPALIRRGRMDMHIELSYCCFEAFKLLARNYLDVETHPLFDTIRKLLEETKITPADVAENLMPKSLELDIDACLENVVSALVKLKEDTRLKAEEEEKEKEKAKLKENEDEQNKGKENGDLKAEGNEKKV